MRCRAVSRTPQPTSVNLALFGHFTVAGADEHGLGVRSLPNAIMPPPACRVAYTSEGTPLRPTNAWPGGRLHLSRGRHPARNKTCTLEPNRSGLTPVTSTSLCKTPRRCKLCLTDIREPLRERDFDTLFLAVVTARPEGLTRTRLAMECLHLRIPVIRRFQNRWRRPPLPAPFEDPTSPTPTPVPGGRLALRCGSSHSLCGQFPAPYA